MMRRPGWILSAALFFGLSGLVELPVQWVVGIAYAQEAAEPSEGDEEAAREKKRRKNKLRKKRRQKNRRAVKKSAKRRRQDRLRRKRARRRRRNKAGKSRPANMEALRRANEKNKKRDEGEPVGREVIRADSATGVVLPLEPIRPTSEQTDAAAQRLELETERTTSPVVEPLRVPETPPPMRRPPPLRRADTPERRKAEGRSESELATGKPSRWSNRGAMLASAEPVESQIPITAPLPERAVPVDVGVATPGQDLIDTGDRISARISFSGFHIQTSQQDFAAVLTENGTPLFDDEGNPIRFEDRSIDLLRARAHLAYEQIAQSEFGVHLDVEYRPRVNGDRFESTILNELYLSYGLTDFRSRDGLWWGVSAGRLAIREAGFAQADGVAARFRLADGIHVGAFGGFTGNPFGYNWRLKNTELFSMDWITGGAFGAIRWGRLSASVAGVLTYANASDDLGVQDAVIQQAGLDRVYVYVDAAYLVTPELNFFLNGWVDVINGRPAQNIELVTSYAPLRDLSFTLGLGRFSTVSYDLSSNYSFIVNPSDNGAANRDLAENVIIGVDGNPVLPFDAALYTATYNSARLRAGYQLLQSVGIFTRVNVWLRDVSATNEQAELFNAQVQTNALRLLPGVGATFSDRDILDASVLFSAVFDDRSNADAFIQGRVGREFFGLRASLDARRFFGAIPGTDAGASLSYVLPRDWFPGLFMIRGTFRYFREDLPDGSLERPTSSEAPDAVPISVQESYQAFGGVEWRL